MPTIARLTPEQRYAIRRAASVNGVTGASDNVSENIRGFVL